MSMKAFRAFAVIAVFTVALGATAQIPVTSASYSQNFDTLASTGASSALPAGWAFAETGTNANATYTAGNGSANAGDTYSFGTTSSDRALGGLQSGSLTPTIGGQFSNVSGLTIVALQIGFTGEQWRLGAAGRVDRIDFQYSLNATSLTTGTWTHYDPLDFTAPVTALPTGLLDGNAAANRTTVSSTIAGLTIPNGSTFWVRWNSFDASGADDGLAIDDFTLLATTGGDPSSTSPTATGSANPPSIQAGGTTTLTVNVTPGSGPISTVLTVRADLSAIGGPSSQTFIDNGGNSFSWLATAGNTTSPGAKVLPVIVSDFQGRSGNTSITLTIEPPVGPVDHVVISQVYGGGGNSGATYRNDYVELYNPTTATVSLAGWSLQYASATGSGWGGTSQPLGGVIGPGRYYLIALASGGAAGSDLPLANINGGINMSGTTGKIALVSNGDPLVGECPLSDPELIDFVGFGTATCREGAANAPAPSNTSALFRKNNGATDTNQNGSDFTAGAPAPRRTEPIAEVGPSIFNTEPSLNGTNEPRDGSVIANFTEAVEVSGGWYNISCASTGSHNDATVAAGGSRSWVITPNVNFAAGEQCTVTIFASYVRDTDTDDSAPGTDTLNANYTWTFTVAIGAAPSYSSDVHLTMGNPSGAVNDLRFPANYLMEKPEFTLSYNRDRGIPNWVSWHLANEWVGTLSRNDTFRPDPAVPPTWYRVLGSDYQNSGYDRGHMVPNADRDPETSIPINQATFLMTNMIPQAPDNNQGPWANMENYLRTLLPANELYIVAGGAGTAGTLANGNVTIPAQTWKVVLVLEKGSEDVNRVTGTARTIAVIMPNLQGIRTGNPNDWMGYITTVDAVEALTGYDFFANVSDAVENAIEAGLNGSNPPGVTNQSSSGNEDAAQSITLEAASGGGSVTYTIVTAPAHGTLSGSGANQTYTPAPDYNGSDSFTFRASDGTRNSNTATVTITVLEVNDASSAANDQKATNEDQLLTFPAATLTANDSAGPANENTQTLTVTEVTATADTHGTVSLSGGQVSYAPAANYNGAASFSYRVCDNGVTRGQSDPLCTTATVFVTVASVNDAPSVTLTAPATSSEGSPVAVSAAVTDVDAGESFTYAWTATKNGAPFAAGSSSSFSFTPNDNGTYAVSLIVTDSNGGNGTASASIAVANSAPVIAAVSGPTTALALGGTASIYVSYTDAGTADTHTATFVWDDGSTSTVACAAGVCTASRAYAAAGVYGVTITVTDDDGASASSRFDYVVVFDPNEGFVTAGGWFESATGKTSFNATAKYQKNKVEPVGNTQLKADGFDFKSTSYEWLVISGSSAQYKGIGTVNGAGSFGFLLTVTDGDVDRFRIKIWERSTNTVVYDNVTGASDDIDAANPQPIASGSIVVHSK